VVAEFAANLKDLTADVDLVSSAANGFNYERAVSLALDQINRAGGIAGTKLRMAAADTSEDPSKAVARTSTLVDQTDLLAILGPDEPDLALDLRPIIDEHAVFQVLPGISVQSAPGEDQDPLRLQLGPAAVGVGCALAEKVYDAGF
jgi:ABC-type branched-subunit amino acid transport system substrate-binding protein